MGVGPTAGDGNRDLQFCPNCGEERPVTANFCPHCGVPDRQTATTTDRDRKRLERRVSDFVVDGWEVEEDFGDRVVLLKRRYGSVGMHVLVAVTTLWWTMGMGNALYALYVYLSNPKRIVLDSDELALDPAATEGASSWMVGLTVLMLWLGSILLFAFAALSAVAGIGWFISATIALVFALLGVGLLPPIQRRVQNRHSITANGRTRSVDEEVVHDPDERCIACFGHVGKGIERTYRDEFAVAGIPVYTYENGANVYCKQCEAERDTPPSPSSSPPQSLKQDDHSQNALNHTRATGDRRTERDEVNLTDESRENE